MANDIKTKRVGLKLTDKKESSEFLENQDNLGRSLSYMIDVWTGLFGTGDVMSNLTDIIEDSIEIRKFLNSEVDIDLDSIKPKSRNMVDTDIDISLDDDEKIASDSGLDNNLIYKEEEKPKNEPVDNDDMLSELGLGFD